MRKLMRKSTWVLMLALGVALLAPMAQAGDQYGYHNGFFLRSADDDFELKLNALFQGGYYGAIFDGAGAANTSTFDVADARTYLSGHAFGPEWTYHLEAQYAAAALYMLEYWANWQYSEAFNVKVGKMKIPYSREFMTPVYNLQFANRSVVSQGFNTMPNPVPGREIGVSFWGNAADKMVEWYLTFSNGFANGNGDTIGVANTFTTQGSLAAGSADIDFRYTARLVLHLMGEQGYWYGDMDMSDEPQLAFGLGVNYNRIDQNNDASYDDILGLTADVMYAIMGFSFAGEFHYLRPDISGGVGDANHISVLGQLGYFLTESMEVAARVAWLMPDSLSRTIQPGAVLNWYLHGRNARVQVQYDIGFLEDGVAAGDDAVNHSGLVQLQFFL